MAKYGELWQKAGPGAVPVGKNGEPLFVLRGQDRLAGAAVRFYATLRYASGDAVGARECMQIADAFEAYHPRKNPD